MNISKQLHILAILLFLALHSGSIHADIDMHVLPGFDGYHKYGRWLPLRITLTSVDEDIAAEVTVEIQDSTTGTRQIYSVPTALFKATRKVQYLYVLPESFRRSLHVRLVDNHGKEVMRKDISLAAISPEDLLIVVAARSGGGLEFLAEHSQADRSPDSSRVMSAPQLRKIYVSYSTAYGQVSNLPLPDKWKGYDSVDVIVLGDISMDAFSDDQRRAITDWVYGGGTLIVSGGAHSQNLVGTFVENLLPVRINETRVLESIPSSLSKLAAFSTSQQLGVDTADRETRRRGDAGKSPHRILVASSELTDKGRVIAVEKDGLPIIAEREVGDGKVIFLAFDYLDPAFRAWAREKVWKRLLPQSTPRKHPRGADVARLFRQQIRESRGALPRAPILSGVFLLLYILCFGPLNYLILKRSNRREWAWITMPAIAAAFTIGALGLIYATRSRAVVVEDLSVVNVYQEMGRARISSYFSLFSPAEPDCKIEFAASEAMFVNWIQSPDSNIYQGAECRLVEKETFQMEILSTKTPSTQLFYGESHVDLSGSVSITLSESDVEHAASLLKSGGVTHGQVISNLPFDLTDCYVFSDGRCAHIGDLTRGARMQVSLEQAHDWDIPGIYSTSGVEKRRLINAMRPSFSRRITGTGVVGWMEGSALKTLAEMKMREDYQALGAALVIVRL
jgi:hypothetical protein